MTIALLMSAALAVPTAAELRAVWDELPPAAVAALHVELPSRELVDWQELAEGEVITRRFRKNKDALHRVFAMRYIDQPPTSIWLSILDGPHADLPDEVYEWVFPGVTPTTKVIYQHLDLPFPLANRHWVIDAKSNVELFRVSDGAAWERSWTLVSDGESTLTGLPEDVLAEHSPAIWTPQNHGAWLLVQAGWGTLALYQLETDIGGLVPQGLLARFAASSLDELLEKTAKLADRAPSHYRQGHRPIYRPDGEPLPPF